MCLYTGIKSGVHDHIHEQSTGSARPSFVSTSLQELEAESSLSPEQVKLKEELILDCAASMYGAGTDSVSGLIYTIQVRYNADHDVVCGYDGHILPRHACESRHLQEGSTRDGQRHWRRATSHLGGQTEPSFYRGVVSRGSQVQ